VTGTRQDTFLAVGVPLGALTLGADWGSRVHNDTAAAGSAEGTRTGLGLKAEYALSKRTSLIASYARWDAAVGQATANTETNLLVSHSF
jgi:predicted porin